MCLIVVYLEGTHISLYIRRLKKKKWRQQMTENGDIEIFNSNGENLSKKKQNYAEWVKGTVLLQINALPQPVIRKQ